MELIHFSNLLKIAKSFQFVWKVFLLITCCATAHITEARLTLSSMRFSNVSNAHLSLSHFPPTTWLHFHLFGGFTMSTQQKPIKCVIWSAKPPTHKTDDIQHNYIHFLLLFSSLSLQREAISSSATLIWIYWQKREEKRKRNQFFQSLKQDKLCIELCEELVTSGNSKDSELMFEDENEIRFF